VDNELEVIHHQMEATRASLADKLDTLENHVLGTVHQATDAVSHTVEDVKSVVDTVTDSIQETVQSVKETFNLRDRVREHPWMSVSGAVAVGFLGGYLLPAPAAQQPEPVEYPPPEPPRPLSRAESRYVEETSDFGPLQKIKELAIGALMNLVRQFAADATPENMKHDVLDLVDDLTTRFGGKPFRGAEESSNGREQARSSAEAGEHNGHHKPPEPASQTEAATEENPQAGKKPERRRDGARRK